MGNTASTVPYGGQISLLNSSLTCTAQDAAAGSTFQTRVGASISLTAPLAVSFIQKIYYSDIHAEYSFDESFLEDERVFGNQYRANITNVLDIVNGSPSITLRESEIRSASTNQLSIPANGGILAPIGPITPLASDADMILDLRVQSLKITLELLDNSNAVKDIITINCGDQSGFEYIIASTFISSSKNSPANAPANGAVGKFPYTPVGSKSTIANIPINCTQSQPAFAQAGGDFTFITGGTLPADLHSNTAFNVTQYNNFFTIPGQLVGALNGFYGTDQSYDFTFATGQDINGNNIAAGIGASVYTANPSTIDIARDFSGASSPLSDKESVDGGSKNPITFALPKFGSLSKSFQAGGCCGSNFGLSINSIEGALTSRAQKSGGTAGTETITCQPLFPQRLLSSQVH